MATTILSQKTTAKIGQGLRGLVKSLLNSRKTKKTETSTSDVKMETKEASAPKKSHVPHRAKRKTSKAKKQAAKLQSESPQEKEQVQNQNQDQDLTPNPAHQPGHRKLNLKKEFAESTGEKTVTQKSALDRNSRADQVFRTTEPHRRIKSAMRSSQSRGRSGKTNSAKPRSH